MHATISGNAAVIRTRVLTTVALLLQKPKLLLPLSPLVWYFIQGRFLFTTLRMRILFL